MLFGRDPGTYAQARNQVPIARESTALGGGPFPRESPRKLSRGLQETGALQLQVEGWYFVLSIRVCRTFQCDTEIVAHSEHYQRTCRIPTAAGSIHVTKASPRLLREVPVILLPFLSFGPSVEP